MVECDICGKNVREQSLPAHKKRHELAEKRPFKCDICGKVLDYTRLYKTYILCTGLHANGNIAGSYEYSQWSKTSQVSSMWTWLGKQVSHLL